MQVTWNRLHNGGWYALNSLNLANSHFNNLHGVYVIFTNTYTVDVGLGEIRTRLGAHRKQFENRPDYMNLKVTWAWVYCHRQFRPLSKPIHERINSFLLFTTKIQKLSKL